MNSCHFHNQILCFMPYNMQHFLLEIPHSVLPLMDSTCAHSFPLRHNYFCYRDMRRPSKHYKTMMWGCVWGGDGFLLLSSCARIVPDMDWGPMGDHFAFFNKIRIISFPVKPRKEKEKLCQKYKYIYRV